MKKLFLMLAAVIGLTGCAVETDVAYREPVMVSRSQWQYGCVDYCDEDGQCREVCDTYYYYGPAGEVFYYDTVYGFWIGPHGWYGPHGWVHGWPYGFREHYRGFYHFHGGGYRGGPAHGEFHGGGGFRGGHGRR